MVELWDSWGRRRLFWWGGVNAPHQQEGPPALQRYMTSFYFFFFQPWRSFFLYPGGGIRRFCPHCFFFLPKYGERRSILAGTYLCSIAHDKKTMYKRLIVQRLVFAKQCWFKNQPDLGKHDSAYLEIKFQRRVLHSHALPAWCFALHILHELVMDAMHVPATAYVQVNCVKWRDGRKLESH